MGKRKRGERRGSGVGGGELSVSGKGEGARVIYFCPNSFLISISVMPFFRDEIVNYLLSGLEGDNMN